MSFKYSLDKKYELFVNLTVERISFKIIWQIFDESGR